MSDTSIPYEDRLERCPFCGGTAEMHHDPDRGAKYPRPTWAGRCISCAAQGPWSKINPADAAHGWNGEWGSMRGARLLLARIAVVQDILNGKYDDFVNEKEHPCP